MAETNKSEYVQPALVGPIESESVKSESGDESILNKPEVRQELTEVTTILKRLINGDVEVDEADRAAVIRYAEKVGNKAREEKKLELESSKLRKFYKELSGKLYSQLHQEYRDEEDPEQKADIANQLTHINKAIEGYVTALEETIFALEKLQTDAEFGGTSLTVDEAFSMYLKTEGAGLFQKDLKALWRDENSKDIPFFFRDISAAEVVKILQLLGLSSKFSGEQIEKSNNWKKNTNESDNEFMHIVIPDLGESYNILLNRSVKKPQTISLAIHTTKEEYLKHVKIALKNRAASS